MKQNKGLFALVTCLALLGGCATTGNTNLNSTLWIQSSSEYKANSLLVYSTAKMNLNMALANKHWSAALEQTESYSLLPAAIVMDIDETVLDNSKYTAKLVLDGSAWSFESWDHWISLKEATAVPGAVSFINFAKSKGVNVILITNRECHKRSNNVSDCPQEQDTIDNLRSVGIDGVQPEDVLMNGEQEAWDSEKKSRRVYIVSKYRVIMLFGDDLGDFLPDVKKNITPAQRHEKVFRYKNNWGTKWYMLTNPTYGSWLSILKKPRVNYLLGY